MNNVTGIMVTHNTRALAQRAFESVRFFHPTLHIIIIDGSDAADPCRTYVESLADDFTTVGLSPRNIGHGRGMDAAIRMCTTQYAFIFDSDIEVLRTPLQAMLDLMQADTYGVGYIEKTAYDGYEYGAKPQHRGQPFMYMLHPFCHMLQVPRYFDFAPYVHHGAPCYKAALDIHLKGLTAKIIKVLPRLGHTAGKGWNWTAVEPYWVRHDTAGTRRERVRRGKGEIEQGWVL